MELPKNLSGYFERAVLDVCAMYIPFQQVINVQARFDITVDNQQRLVLDIEENVKHSMKVYNKGGGPPMEPMPMPAAKPEPIMQQHSAPSPRGRGSRGSRGGRGSAGRGGTMHGPRGASPAHHKAMPAMGMRGSPIQQRQNQMPSPQGMRPPMPGHMGGSFPAPQGHMGASPARPPYGGQHPAPVSSPATLRPPSAPKAQPSKQPFQQSNSDLLNQVLGQVLGRYSDSSTPGSSSTTKSVAGAPPPASAAQHGPPPPMSPVQAAPSTPQKPPPPPPLAGPMNIGPQGMPSANMPAFQPAPQSVPMDSNFPTTPVGNPQMSGPPPPLPHQANPQLSSMPLTNGGNGTPQRRPSVPDFSPAASPASRPSVSTPTNQPQRPSSASSTASSGSAKQQHHMDPVVKLTKLPDAVLHLVNKAQEQRESQDMSDIEHKPKKPRLEGPQMQSHNNGPSLSSQLPPEVLQIVNKARLERDDGGPPPDPQPPDGSLGGGNPDPSSIGTSFLGDSLARFMPGEVMDIVNKAKSLKGSGDSNVSMDLAEGSTEKDGENSGINTLLSFSSDLSDLDNIKPFTWPVDDVSGGKGNSENDSDASSTESYPLPLVCSVCCTQCDSAAHHKEHMLKCHNQHACIECGRSYPTPEELRAHQERDHKHSKESQKVFSCNECGRRLNSMNALKIHMKVNHNPGQAIFKCDVCEKPFKTAGSLKVHMMMHTSYKPYRCDKCQMGFFNEAQFQQHISQCEAQDQRAIVISPEPDAELPAQ